MSETKLTPWFKDGRKSRRAGVYRVRWWILTIRSETLVTAYAYWSRRLGWRNYGHTPREAMQRKHYPHPCSSPQWRGLQQPQSPKE
jgi:hypothetical protein